MSKNVRRSEDESPEKTIRVLIPFKRKRTDKNGFQWWIGNEVYEVPLSVLATIKDALKAYKREDEIQQEGYQSVVKKENVSISLPDSYLEFLMKLFEL